MMSKKPGKDDGKEEIYVNISSSSESGDSEIDASFTTRCNKLTDLLSQEIPERVRLKELAKECRKSYHFRRSQVHAAVLGYLENQEQNRTPINENKNSNLPNTAQEDTSANTRRRRFLTSSTPLVCNALAQFSSGDVSSIGENSEKEMSMEKEKDRSVQKSDKNRTIHTPEIISINNSTDSQIRKLEASEHINRTPRRGKENSVNVTKVQEQKVPEEENRDVEAEKLQENQKNVAGNSRNVSRSLRSGGKKIVEAEVEEPQVSKNVTNISTNNSTNVTNNSKSRSLRNVTNNSKKDKVMNNNRSLKKSVSVPSEELRRSVLKNNHRRSSVTTRKVPEVIPESDDDFDWPIDISGVGKTAKTLQKDLTATEEHPESPDSSTGSESASTHTNYLYESLEKGPMEISSPKPWRGDFPSNNARESISLGLSKIMVDPHEDLRMFSKKRKKSVYSRFKNGEDTKESRLLSIVSQLSLMKQSNSSLSSDEDDWVPKPKIDVQNNNRIVKDQTPVQINSPQKNKSTNKKKVVSSKIVNNRISSRNNRTLENIKTPQKNKSTSKKKVVSSANHRSSPRTPQKDITERIVSPSPSRSPVNENKTKSPQKDQERRSLRSSHKENSSPRIASRSPPAKSPKKAKDKSSVNKTPQKEKISIPETPQIEKTKDKSSINNKTTRNSSKTPQKEKVALRNSTIPETPQVDNNSPQSPRKTKHKSSTNNLSTRTSSRTPKKEKVSLRNITIPETPQIDNSSPQSPQKTKPTNNISTRNSSKTPQKEKVSIPETSHIQKTRNKSWTNNVSTRNSAKTPQKEKVFIPETPHIEKTKDKSSTNNISTRNSSKTPQKEKVSIPETPHIQKTKDKSSTNIISTRNSSKTPQKEKISLRSNTIPESPHIEKRSNISSPPPKSPQKTNKSPLKANTQINGSPKITRSSNNKTIPESPQKENTSPNIQSNTRITRLLKTKSPTIEPSKTNDFISPKRPKTGENPKEHVFSPVRRNLFNTHVETEHEIPNIDNITLSGGIADIPPLIEYLQLQLSPRSDKTKQTDKNTTTEKQDKDVVNDKTKESNSSRSGNTSGVRTRGKAQKRLPDVDASAKMPPPKAKPRTRKAQAQMPVNTEDGIFSDLITSTTNTDEINETQNVRKSGRNRRPPEPRYKLDCMVLTKTTATKRQSTKKSIVPGKVTKPYRASSQKTISKALQNTLNNVPAQCSVISSETLLNYSNILNLTDKGNKSAVMKFVSDRENINMVKKGKVEMGTALVNIRDDVESGYMTIKPDSQTQAELIKKNSLTFVTLSGRGEIIVNNVASEISHVKNSSFAVPSGIRYLIKNTSCDDDLILFYVKS